MCENLHTLTLTFEGYVTGRAASGQGGKPHSTRVGSIRAVYQRIEWAMLVQYGRLWIAVYMTIVWPKMKAGRT